MTESIAKVARQKLGMTTVEGELIDETIGSKNNRTLIGGDGLDRLIAGSKGRYELWGDGGPGESVFTPGWPDQYVLSPSENDFDQLEDGNKLGSQKNDLVSFRHEDGDTLFLDKQSFKGINPKNYSYKVVYAWKDLHAAASTGGKNKIIAKVEEDYSLVFYDSNGSQEGFGDFG